MHDYQPTKEARIQALAAEFLKENPTEAGDILSMIKKSSREVKADTLSQAPSLFPDQGTSAQRRENAKKRGVAKLALALQRNPTIGLTLNVQSSVLKPLFAELMSFTTTKPPGESKPAPKKEERGRHPLENEVINKETAARVISSIRDAIKTGSDGQPTGINVDEIKPGNVPEAAKKRFRELGYNRIPDGATLTGVPIGINATRYQHEIAVLARSVLVGNITLKQLENDPNHEMLRKAKELVIERISLNTRAMAQQAEAMTQQAEAMAQKTRIFDRFINALGNDGAIRLIESINTITKRLKTEAQGNISRDQLLADVIAELRRRYKGPEAFWNDVQAYMNG